MSNDFAKIATYTQLRASQAALSAEIAATTRQLTSWRSRLAPFLLPLLRRLRRRLMRR